MTMVTLKVIGRENGEDVFVLPAGTQLIFNGSPVTLKADTEILGDIEWMAKRWAEVGSIGSGASAPSS